MSIITPLGGRRGWLRLGALATVLLGVQGAEAMPALNKSHVLQQPDGSEVQARKWGDEWSRGWQTSEGYTMVQDEESREWRFATLDAEGNLIPGRERVGRDQPPAGVGKALRPRQQAQQRMLQKMASRQSSSAQAAAQRASPATGVNNIPVLLTKFSDHNNTYSVSQFNDLLFGSGGGTLASFYSEISGDRFTVSGGSSGVTGWYTAANGHDYYGRNVFGSDGKPATLVIEAVKAADSAVNFADYDMDGDCNVDIVVVVYQGTGEEASYNANDIWAHQWDLNSAKSWGDGTGAVTTGDSGGCGKVKVNQYLVVSEMLDNAAQTIGIFAHEYGHALGLPDLYDTDYSSEGAGYWELMAGGGWNGVTRDGDSPAHMSAWSKYALGWVSPIPVSGTLDDVNLAPVAEGGEVYQLLDGDAATGTGEYFLVENRQQVGFDAGLPGAGLAIWHVDEAKETNDAECLSSRDCTRSHYKVALMQADGKQDLERLVNGGDTGDLYPGATGNTRFAVDATPDSALYDGSDSGVSVTGIVASGTDVVATLSTTGEEATDDPVPDVKINNTDTSVTLTKGSRLIVTVQLDAAGAEGENGTWRISSTTGSGATLYYNRKVGWKSEVLDAYQGVVGDSAAVAVTNTTRMPVGTHTFTFTVTVNGKSYSDTASVTVR